MAIRGVAVVLLCEDDAHVNLIRNYLYLTGLKRHEIRVRPIAGGRGAGEKFVRDQFPREVQEQRQIVNKIRRTILIVVTDADALSVQERLDLLTRDTPPPPPSRNELIAILIPKRNVETWIRCLRSESADEAADFKRDEHGESPAESARRLYECARPHAPTPANFVPSLIRGIGELRRLESLAVP